MAIIYYTLCNNIIKIYDNIVNCVLENKEVEHYAKEKYYIFNIINLSTCNC